MPTIVAYDPALAFELAVIIRDGIRRMYQDVKEDIFYYITLYNDNYPMLPMPEGSTEGILKGLYKLRPAANAKAKAPKAHLFGSGPILMHTLRAQELLAEHFGVAADVWSATSYKELAARRWRWSAGTCCIRRKSRGRVTCKRYWRRKTASFLAASDNMRAVPEMIARWVPGGLFPLGTDGFGRSETRAALRRHFEVDAECITVATLYQLAQRGAIKPDVVQKAMQKFEINPEKISPMRA